MTKGEQCNLSKRDKVNAALTGGIAYRADGGENNEHELLAVDGLAAKVVGGEAEGELADDGADVGGGLHEALQAGGERRAAVQTVLEHRGDGLWTEF